MQVPQFLKCQHTTSAPSERCFSEAGLVLTEKRNRLHGEIVEQLIFLDSCWSLLEKLIEEETKTKTSITLTEEIINVFE